MSTRCEVEIELLCCKQPIPKPYGNTCPARSSGCFVQFANVRHNAVQLVCRVDAVPGSGKTRVLISRIAHLIQERGVSPRSILAITFTRKAAGQLQARIAASLGERTASQVVSGNRASWIVCPVTDAPLHVVWAYCPRLS